MGPIDDTRKLLQDLVTPDFRALDARVVALEQKMDLKLDHLDKKFEAKIDALDKKFEGKVDLLEAKIDALDKKFEGKIDALDKKIDLKFDLVVSTMAANHATVMRYLDIDRRVERLELAKKSLDRPS